jgi:hypothetical protein
MTELEEAAERLFRNESGDMSKYRARNISIELAKWQVEKMYSDKEVLELLCKREWCYEHTIPFISVDDWFEQNKKK